ncbi:uncharacterized protein ARMOST_15304 [Armillaria ostoyae]|uniref:Uncharacterized protein n=1 Tax=Armillaria ostoyae TaxID=47428 RepID=A0A284RT31_ARMOS|nr:uncharacterized protein ARMOST_15304 [Armillaria ostoyae]
MSATLTQDNVDSYLGMHSSRTTTHSDEDRHVPRVIVTAHVLWRKIQWWRVIQERVELCRIVVMSARYLEYREGQSPYGKSGTQKKHIPVHVHQTIARYGFISSPTAASNIYGRNYGAY